RDGVGHGVAGVGRGVVDGVGHRQVGGPGAAGLHVSHHRDGVVALVGVVLPAHDRGRVVDRAAADGVDGDGHRGRATAVEGAEGAADVLLVGGAHALRGRRLHEPDAARQLVVEVDV